MAEVFLTLSTVLLRRSYLRGGSLNKIKSGHNNAPNLVTQLEWTHHARPSLQRALKALLLSLKVLVQLGRLKLFLNSLTSLTLTVVNEK